MFNVNFRKLLLEFLSGIIIVSLLGVVGGSNCFAITDDNRAMIFSEYVMEKLDEQTKNIFEMQHDRGISEDKVNLDEYFKVNSDNFLNYPCVVYRYDDKEIEGPNKSKELIEDEIVEKEVYEKIKKTVENLVAGIDEKTDLNKARVIFEWVVQNIKYDYDSVNMSVSATQNAFCAFEYKKAVCDGFAKLLQMMMRLAGIPCKYVASIPSRIVEENKLRAHAFNAIYLNDGQRTGWTLLDSTWASCMLHNPKSSNNSENNKIFKMFFPALDKDKSLKDANKNIMRMKSHKIKCIKNNCDVEGHAENFNQDTIIMCSYIGHLRLMYIPNSPIPSIGDIFGDSYEDINGELNNSSCDDGNISGLKVDKEYNIKILNEVFKFNTPIFFKNGEEDFIKAEKVFVEGDVEIDFEMCEKRILDVIKSKLDLSKSNRYKFDENNHNVVLDKETGNKIFDFGKIVLEK